MNIVKSGQAYQGTMNFKIPLGTICDITTDRDFCVYGLDEKQQPVKVYGPPSSHGRKFTFKSQHEIMSVHIPPKGYWSIDFITKIELAENRDDTPLELPVDYKPSNSEDRIKRFLIDYIHAKDHANEFETFEEADDFEVDDDGLVPLTQYEITELQAKGYTDEELNPKLVKKTKVENPSTTNEEGSQTSGKDNQDSEGT